MARPRRGPDPPAGSGSGSAASCPRRDRRPRGRCPAAPGTSRSGAPRPPRLRIRPSLPWPNLDNPDVGRLRALGGLAKLVLDLRALGEGTEAVTRDTGEVHECILAPVIRGDEPEALLVAEPLHDTGSQTQHLLTTVLMREVVLPGTAFPHASSPLGAALTSRVIPVAGRCGARLSPAAPECRRRRRSRCCRRRPRAGAAGATRTRRGRRSRRRRRCPSRAWASLRPCPPAPLRAWSARSASWG